MGPSVEGHPQKKATAMQCSTIPTRPQDSPLRLSITQTSGAQDGRQGSALVDVPRPGRFLNISLFLGFSSRSPPPRTRSTPPPSPDPAAETQGTGERWASAAGPRNGDISVATGPDTERHTELTQKGKRSHQEALGRLRVHEGHGDTPIPWGGDKGPRGSETDPVCGESRPRCSVGTVDAGSPSVNLPCTQESPIPLGPRTDRTAFLATPGQQL